MGILLWILGVLVLGAGAVKLRERTRALVGTSPLAMAEVAAGGLLAIGAAMGLARVRPLAWGLIGVSLTLAVVSGIVHARRLGAAAERRERSAESRFRRYLGWPDT